MLECIDNTVHTVCASGLDEEDIQVICRDRSTESGYLVQSEDALFQFYRPIEQAGVTDISCPDNSGFFSQYFCSYQVSYDHCNASGGPALIACYFPSKLVVFS